MRLIEPAVEVLSNSYVAPLSRMVLAAGNSVGSFNGGVYYADGGICTTGLQIKSGYVNEPDDISDLKECSFHNGGHVFCGMLQNEHFGHFMIENLTRLWAVKDLGSRYEFLVYYSRSPGLPVPNFALEIFDLLGITQKIKLISEITRFELLAVPNPIVGADIGVMYGHPAIRELFDPFRRLLSSSAPRKVYVSRSGLDIRGGGLLLEMIIEQNLIAEGYQIVHPERISIREQVEIYSSADQLIFADGSAVHLYAVVSRQDQDLFVIWRRKVNHLFEWQIRSFGGAVLHGNPCLASVFGTTGDAARQMVGAKGMLDFDSLGRQLKAAGFITGNNWIVPDKDELTRELARVEQLVGAPLIDYGINY